MQMLGLARTLFAAWLVPDPASAAAVCPRRIYALHWAPKWNNFCAVISAINLFQYFRCLITKNGR